MRGSIPLAVLAFLLILPDAHAQDEDFVGRVTGTVTLATDDLPIPGVHVFLQHAGIGSVTDDRGRYALENIPPGRFTMVVRYVGYETVTRSVEVADDTTEIDFSLSPATEIMDEIVVTAIGERQSRADVAATVQSIDEQTIERIKPAHPSDLMSRVPGVWVNTTAGEGHTAAIRQPLTMDAVYLYLENGVPTRSSGFFNHNALAELNLPMAGSIEVMKGPGSALYGSDAIGGVVNLSTLRPPFEPTARVSLESGSFGYGRIMLSTGTHTGGNGIRLDLLGAKSDGWRDAGQYDRQSATLTVNTPLEGTSRLQTVASFTRLDQTPAGASSLTRPDFEQEPTTNYTPISFRNMASFRISTAYERFTRGGAVTVTPFARANRMEILPNWSILDDPSVLTSTHVSVGLLARYRHDFERIGLRAVAGMDFEASPGEHDEHLAVPSREGRFFTDFHVGEPIYRYDVTFQQASPYLHTEWEVVDRLRLNAGLRADLLGFIYDNLLEPENEGPHRRAPDTMLRYSHLSPKLGATYRLGSVTSAFASYRHAFRVPSQSQLFRQGSTTNTLDLKPVKADNFEVGLRLQPDSRLRADVSAYYMQKTDDIVTFVDETGVRISTNAGETSHRGIEAGLELGPIAGLQLTGSYAYAVHRFEEWQPSAEADFGGNEMPIAPRSMGFAELAYRLPFLPDVTLAVEARRLGNYWMNPENTFRYDGHTLFALHGSLDLPVGVTAFARVTNLTNELYAEWATYDALRGEQLVPGQPRAVYFGLSYGVSGF